MKEILLCCRECLGCNALEEEFFNGNESCPYAAKPGKVEQVKMEGTEENQR